MKINETDLFVALKEALVEGKQSTVEETIKKITKAGVDSEKVLGEMVQAMDVVNERWKKMEIFLPDVMLAAEAMKAGIRTMETDMMKKKSKTKKGKVVIGTVSGDIHDIGKTIVSIMLEISGFEILDLGHDVEPKIFVGKAQEIQADMIALSSLMTTTMPFQRDVIRLLKDQNLREKYRVIVGGGTTSAGWAEEIGADGYGRTGPDAVEVAKKVMHIDEKTRLPIIEGS